MISGQSFVDALRSINYPKAEELDGSSFDYMFENLELLPFLECFCNTIGEENVLTPEELAEFEALPSDEITEGSFEKALLPLSVEQSVEELSDEIAFLKAEHEATTKYNDVLGRQIGNLRLQEESLVRETEDTETLLKHKRKNYRKLQDEAAPSAERKVVDDLKHLSAHVQEVENLLSKPPDSQMTSCSKTFSQLNLKPCLKAETTALEHINSYISMSLNEPFPCQKTASYDHEDGLHESVTASSNNEDPSELSLLMENLKISEEVFLKVSCKKSKAEMSLKFYEEKVDLDRYLQTAPVVRASLEEAQETYKRFEQEEKRLILSIPEVVQEYIQTQRNWISVLCGREKLADCKSLLARQALPLDLLYEQRARLELLSLFMDAEETDLQSIFQSISNASSTLENERLSLLKRETQMDEILKKSVPSDEIFISENSALCHLHKILTGGIDCSYVTPESLLEKATRLRNIDCELDEKLQSTFHQHAQHVKAIQCSSAFYDDLLYEKKWNSVLHPVSSLQSVASDLNVAHLKLKELEALIMKVMNNYLKKQKMIQQNITLRKARRLFVAALTNPSHFHQIVNEIKLQMENTSLSRIHH